MSQHVPEDLLAAFVEGEVGDQLAVHIAEHLDACPSCATRAAALEPLAQAFAAVEDPAVPDDLVSRVLTRLNEPEVRPVAVEVLVAVALLAAAALFAALTGDPLEGVVQVGVLADVVASFGSRVGAAVTSSAVALTLTSLAALSTVVVTARVALLEWRLP